VLCGEAETSPAGGASSDAFFSAALEKSDADGSPGKNYSLGDRRQPHGACAAGYSTFSGVRSGRLVRGVWILLESPASAALWQQRNQYAMFKQSLSRPNFFPTKIGKNVVFGGNNAGALR
jgi:hypothetical protein